MRENTRKIYISELIILLAIVLLLITISNPLYTFRNVLIIVSLFISFIILIHSFGWKKDNKYLKKYTIMSLSSLLMTYLILIYALGIILGFNKGFVSYNLNYFKSLIATIIIIVLLESVRYLVCSNSHNSKMPIIIFTILSVILCVILEINISNLDTSEKIFIFLSTIIFPIIAEEILCTYMTYKISFVTSIIFKAVLKLYMFIIPIVPSLGNYIYSAINVIFPYIIYIVINKSVVKYEKTKLNLKKSNLTVYSIPLLLVFVVLVVLVSGIFKYKMIAVATNSMNPVYGRGDAVIYEKVSPEQIEVGDILAFKKNNVIITHRVTKKWISNNSYHFNTKGDNNEIIDAFVTNGSDVLGKVEFTIKYIGYPTVLVREFFERSK